MVEVLSATSIQVSWDILDIPEITRYIVYYSQTVNSEMATIVSDSENSVTIDNLLTNEEYQFQVVAVAELDGDMIIGERSNVSVAELDMDMIMGERSNVSVSPASTDSETQCE